VLVTDKTIQFFFSKREILSSKEVQKFNIALKINKNFDRIGFYFQNVMKIQDNKEWKYFIKERVRLKITSKKTLETLEQIFRCI